MEKAVERLSLQRIICKAGKKCFQALRKFSRRRPVSPMEPPTLPPVTEGPAPATDDRNESDDEYDYDSYDDISLTTVDTWVAGDEAADNQLNEALEKKLAAM